MTIDLSHNPYTKKGVLDNFWELINETVNRFSDKDFIVSKNGKLTYKEVNLQANVICAALLGRSQSAKVGVGLFLNDPLKIIPAMMGTLKAGYYFVPLDVTFPARTLNSILDDAEIKIILTDQENFTQAKSLIGPGTALLNFDALDLAAQVPEPIVHYQPDDWVQILFTSGSSGEPKGAIETYRYLAYGAYQKCTTRNHNARDRVLQLSSFTFSAPHTLVFAALMIGLTLYYYNIKEDGFVGLADWIRKQKITSYSSSATVFRTWANTLRPGDQFPTVTFGHVGGEKVLPGDIKNLKKHFPNLDYIYVSFGSTETLGIASKLFPPNYDFEESEIPCGIPNEGIKVLIWDGNGNELPVGETGEIVVYGDTLAQGYINNPKLTKERFIQDPKKPTYHYYRTGDRGKLRKDGQLFHLGRLDDMVKIKGVRIELNSLEAHMLKYPGIVQVAFKAFDDRKGNKKLVAYYIGEQGIAIPTSDLRKFLAERLPTQLLPHYFIKLEQFPLTHTGKLARNQLPVPKMMRPQLSNPYEPPSNELEATLVKIWEDEIGIDGIGVSDDFFEVGGDLLIGVLLFIQIERVLGRNLPVSTLLSASTIRRQAEIIRDQDTSQDFSTVITIKSQGNHAPLFFIPGKAGYPTRIRYLAREIESETPVYALQELSGVSEHKPLRRIESKATFYINAIKKVVPHGPYILVGESMGGKVAYDMACQLVQMGEEIPILAMLDTYNMAEYIFDESSPRYYWMLFKKHLTILLHSSWQGRLDYLKFYREKLFTELDSILKRYVRLRRIHKSSSVSEDIKQTENANKAAGLKYHPKPYPGRVILFKAQRGPYNTYPSNGWDQIKIGELAIHELDCYHGSILFEPAVIYLAEILNTYIG